MRTIWKYPLESQNSRSVFAMPKGAEFLSVQAQGDWACLWALVDPSKPLTPRGVRLYGTGHDVPDCPESGPYVGTFQSGPFVFHAFEDLSCINSDTATACLESDTMRSFRVSYNHSDDGDDWMEVDVKAVDEAAAMQAAERLLAERGTYYSELGPVRLCS